MTIFGRSVSYALVCVTLAIPGRAGQIVDRVVANVNGHVLLQSDWEEELAFEAFVDARAVDSFTAAERKAALDRLIDQELLREEVKPVEGAPDEIVNARLAEIRKLHADASTDAGWQAALQRYGLTPASLQKRLAADIEIMRLVEDRLRPSIQIDTRAVESYYHEHLLPELQKSGTKEVPLPEVFGRIKDLLAEQRMTQLVSTWLVSLRSQSRIQIQNATVSGSTTPGSAGGEQNR